MSETEASSLPPHQTRRAPFVTLMLTAAAAVILPSIGLAAALLDEPQSTMPTAHPQVTQATPENLELVCLDQHIDAFDNHATPPLETWTFPTHLGRTHERSLSINTTTTPEFFALTTPVQSGGELRTLNLLACTQPRVTHWFAAGKTTAGHDTSIRVVNPSTRPAVVNLRFWTSTGPVTQQHSVTIPAGGASTIRPGYYIPEETRLAVQLSSQGPGIGAWMQVSDMDGEVPQGSTWLDSTHPASTHTLLGIGPEAVLRVANPSGTDTTIHLTWTTAHDQTPIPGGSVELAAGSVTDISLPAHSDGIAAVTVTSEQHPVLAQAWSHLRGEPWAKTEKTQLFWASATSYTSAQPLRHAVLPDAAAMDNILLKSAQTPLIRTTSIPTPSGMTIDTITLIAYNPHTIPVELTVPGSTQQTSTIPPGRLHSLDLGTRATSPATPTPADGQQSTSGHEAAGGLITVDASNDLHMAVIVEATTPTGPLRAVMPIRAESLATAAVPVLIRH